MPGSANRDQHLAGKIAKRLKQRARHKDNTKQCSSEQQAGTYEHSRELVQHPVTGRIQALQVLLGTTNLRTRNPVNTMCSSERMTRCRTIVTRSAVTSDANARRCAFRFYSRPWERESLRMFPDPGETARKKSGALVASVLAHLSSFLSKCATDQLQLLFSSKSSRYATGPSGSPGLFAHALSHYSTISLTERVRRHGRTHRRRADRGRERFSVECSSW